MARVIARSNERNCQVDVSFFEKVVDTHCVRDKTVVGVSTIFCINILYLYLKIKLNDSPYRVLASELDLIEPSGCRRADEGWKEGGRWERAGRREGPGWRK